MKDNRYILNTYDVLDLDQNNAKAVSYKTILNADALKNFKSYIYDYLVKKANCYENVANNVASSWVEDGVDCDLLVPDKGWQQGKVRLALVFEPDEKETEEVKETENKKAESPLDDIRQEIQSQKLNY